MWSGWEYPKEGGGYTPCLNSVYQDPGDLLEEALTFELVARVGVEPLVCLFVYANHAQVSKRISLV